MLNTYQLLQKKRPLPGLPRFFYIAFIPLSLRRQSALKCCACKQVLRARDVPGWCSAVKVLLSSELLHNFCRNADPKSQTPNVFCCMLLDSLQFAGIYSFGVEITWWNRNQFEEFSILDPFHTQICQTYRSSISNCKQRFKWIGPWDETYKKHK